MSYHTSGVLFKNSFGTPEMREVVSEERFVEEFLAVEAALARAEADAGLVPDDVAAEITEKASLEYVDLDRVEENVADIGLFTMSIIGAWREAFGEAGEYIHWGATSQDISDTALMLQLRDGYEIVLRDLTEIRTLLADLAAEHRDTPMIGRTHHVQATPITFGLKVATWLDEIDRHVERLEALRERLFVLEFFGATGTMASLGEVGPEIQENLSAELDLDVPDVAWFASRDRLAELLDVFAMIASTLSKIANQILILNRPVIDEVNEPIPEGEVGSSTMPHKRNPVRSEGIVSMSHLVRAHASTMVDVMDGYDERDCATWFVEFAVVPEAFLYQSRLLANAIEVLDGLVVNPETMRENMNLFGGLVSSEAVMMELADHVGRQTAHEIVYENAMAAMQSGQSFTERLRSDDRVTDHLSEADIDRVTDPEEYTGLSAQFVDRVLDRVREK